MNIKTKAIGALFVSLVIVLAVNPRAIHNLYNSILGRIFLIGIVIFLSMNNVTLGLLVALAIVAASNQFAPFVEGMENSTSTTVGEDNTATTGSQKVLTGDAVKQLQNMTPEQQQEVSKRISDLKAKAEAAGVDTEAIKTAIAAKDSKTIPVDSSSKTSEEVSAFIGKSSLEGFCSSCAAV